MSGGIPFDFIDRETPLLAHRAREKWGTWHPEGP